MDSKTFSTVVDTQVQKSVDLLLSKNDDYNPGTDKLDSFRAAALLGKSNMREALGGMMIKHTVSIYDMINSGKQYPEMVWDEKIMDHINYLLLLRAVVEEDHAIMDTAEKQSDDVLTALRDKLMVPAPSTPASSSTTSTTSAPASTPSTPATSAPAQGAPTNKS